MEDSTKEKVDQWLNGNYDDNTKAQIQKLIDDKNDNELTDSFYKDLEFGTGGLRGVMGVGSNRMNKYTVAAATQGLANYLHKQYPDLEIRVAIAHDNRNHSDFFAGVTADIFTANGIKVYFFESLRPTPELSFAIRYFNCQSGIVITASHNPKEYNGYKAYWEDGAQIIAPHDENIIDEVNKIKSLDDIHFNANDELLEVVGDEVDEHYLCQLESLSINPEMIKRQSELKIVFSPIHGTGYKLIPEALHRFGFNEVHTVDEQMITDGNFPTVVYTNPEEAEAMNMALKKAEEIDAELVMATDPDADRVGIAVKNDKGEFQLLNGNQTGSLLIYYMLEAWKKADKLHDREFICKTIVTTELIDAIAKDYGVDCYNVLTGFKFIAGKIRELEGEKTFIAGGEESYGYLIGDIVRDKDAVAACAFIAEMAAFAKDQGKTLYSLLLDLYVKYGCYQERLISVTKKGKSGAEEIQQMMTTFRETPPKTINGSKVITMIDYKSSESIDLVSGEKSQVDLPSSNVLQYYLEDGTKISARPSGTEPKIKFYFSVNKPLDSTGNYDKVKKELDERIDHVIRDLKL